MSFEKNLGFGKVAESQIAQWLRRGGWAILPVYEKLIDEGKGPQLYTASTELVAPDLLAFRERRVLWIEVKHKTAFTWHRKTERWVTGIDQRHYEDYLSVEKQSPWPVYLLFLHRGGCAKDSPTDSPSGLFGERLSFLKENINHKHDKWGKGGMVYWWIGTLRKFTDLDNLASSPPEFPDYESAIQYRQNGNQYTLAL